MRKIYYKLDIGYTGCGYEGVSTVADDMPDSEIDEMVNDMALQWAESWEGDSRLGWDDDMTDEEQEQQTEDFYQNVCGSWRFVK